MRILHVVNDAQTGGAQTLIEALGRQRQPGDEMHILVLMARGALSDRFELIADSVHYAGMKQRDIVPIKAMLMLRRLVRSLRIDLVHSHLLQSDLVSAITPLSVLSRAKTIPRAKAIPRVSTVHTSGAHETRRISRLVGKIVARLSRKFTVIACSRSAQAYAARAGYHTDINIIWNGTRIDPEPMTVPSIPSLRFVQLARWHPMKGHDVLFAALHLMRTSHPDVRLDCAGLGMEPGNPEVLALLDRHGVADLVTLHGSVQNVHELFLGSRALVIASGHGEALPMAGIEALGSGLPVLSTDVGDCAELVVAPAYLVQPKKPAELAAALISMLDLAAEEYARLAQASRLLAEERYDERLAAQQYRELYLKLVSP